MQTDRSNQPESRPAGHLLAALPAWVAGLILTTSLPVLADPPKPVATTATGEQIYRQACLRCHGPSGEGTKEYDRALAGDKSITQLAKLIAKTMPEDDPGTCTGEDALKVAEYIHGAFYSPLARERNRPARIELSRLTVRQYRNAVADLIGSFRSGAVWPKERGLHGEYFDARGFRFGSRVIDRRDPTVAFDFGETTPDPAKFKGQDFTIRWEGSVLAPDTGDYEFVVRTEHATRLYVNDMKAALIDAWVKSGKDTEFRGTVRLLGGRAYPLRLEFSKAKQGVDDSKTRKKAPPPVKASIALLWKRPQSAIEVIPERNLSPARPPELFVVTTPFPPDDRSIGYDRGTSVSKAWDQATTDAAIEAATYVGEHLRELTGASEDPKDKDRVVKLQSFAGRLAERAFRRPLDADQRAAFITRQFQEASDPVVALKRVILLVLKSPRFLYREINVGTPDGYDVATRLSFGLWDSLPDTPLLEAAASGKLATREQVAAQAERMVDDVRTRSKVREFLLQWLKVDQVPDVSKDPKLYPGFDSALVTDLRTSLELFLDEVVWGESSDFRQFLLADGVYLNGRLAAFYGVEMPGDAPFRKVTMERERAGVLSHPYLMAAFAYTGSTSPIHRGVFIARGVLGRAIRTPPVAVAPLAPDLHADLTTRERVILQTSPEACQTCHAMINPLGFPLERFDAVGRFRATENGKPVDATGTYQVPEGETVKFDGARDFANFLAGSGETHTSFVEQVFHHLVKQPVRAYGPNALKDLSQAFAGNQFHIRKLLVEVLASTALTPRVSPPELARTR
ncbi:MAG: DUF1592 domain-containing protein [Isosphaeraceae bacterium]